MTRYAHAIANRRTGRSAERLVATATLRSIPSRVSLLSTSELTTSELRTASGPVGPDSVSPDLRPKAPEIPEEPTDVWSQLRDIGAKPGVVAYLKDLWAWRDFATTLALGELRSQNQDTILGQFWHLLNPMLLTLVYWLIFGVVLDVSRGVEGPYVPFLVIGVVVFNYTRTAVTSGARIIVKNRNLVQSVNFPRTLLPVGAMIEETISQVFAMVVMFLVVVGFGFLPTVHWLLVIPIMALQFLFSAGIGMATARLTFHFRDVQEVIPYLMRIWFYGSGVLFPVDGGRVEEMGATVQWLLRLNPMNAIIEITRDAVLYATIDPLTWVIALGWTVVIIVFGFWYFRAAEAEYGRV